MGKFTDDVGGYEESAGILDNTGDFLHYGLVDIGVSAGLSFTNTAVALGNALGGEFDQVDTEETIRQHISDNAADYYRDNSAMIDTAGLVVGSLVPGLTAIKASKAFAAGVLETRTSTLATGIRKAMVPEGRVEALMKSIESGARPLGVKSNLTELVKQNAMQNFAESAIYETATLLTMNQSSALNPDHLGYFQAIAHNAGDSMVGIALGTGIGGALGTIVDAASLTKAMKFQELEAFKNKNVTKSGLDIRVGDEITITAASVKEVKSRLRDLDNMTPEEAQAKGLERTQLTAALNSAEKYITEQVRDNSVGYNFGKVMNKMFSKSANGLGDSGNLMIGARKVSTLKLPKAVGTEVKGTSLGDQGASAQLGLWETKYLGAKTPQAVGLARLEADLLSDKLGEIEANVLGLDAIGHMKAETVDILWNSDKLAKKQRISIKGPTGKIIPTEQLSVADRLKLGMKVNRAGEWPTKVSTMVDLRTMLQEFSYEHFPAYRQLVDLTGEIATNLEKADPELVGKLVGDVVAMNHPSQLFSNAFNVFNKLDIEGKLDKKVIAQIQDATGKYRPLYEFMNNNEALGKKYGTVSSIVDSHTGGVALHGVTPHIADLGEVIVKPGRVTGQQGVSLDIKPGMKLEGMSGVQASAMHAWGASMFGAREAMRKGVANTKSEWTDAMTKDSIVELTAMLDYHDFTQFPVTLGDKTVVDSATTARKLVVDAKKNLILKSMVKSDNAEALSMHDIALLADVDFQYALGVVGRDAKKIEEIVPGSKQFTTGSTKLPSDFGPEFLTKELYYSVDNSGKTAIEEFSPRYMEVHYDSQVFDPLGRRQDSFGAVMSRLFAEREVADRVVEQVLPKDFADKIRSINFDPLRRVDQSAASSVTSVSQTSGFIAANSQRALSFEAAAGEIGRLGTAEDLRSTKLLHERAHSAASALLKNQQAEMELSILAQSTLRTGKYKFAPTEEVFVTEVLMPKTAQIFQDAKVDIVGTLANAYQRGLRTSGSAGKLIDTNLYEVIAGRLNTLARQTLGSQADQSALRAQLQEIEDTVVNLLDGADNSVHKMAHDIRHRETVEALQVYMAEHSADVKKQNMLAQLRGEPADLDPDVIYPGKMDTKTFKHVGFVRMKDRNSNLWSTKKNGMIFAHNEDDLARQEAHLYSKFGRDQIEVITPKQKTEWAKAEAEYNAELAFNETNVDSSLRSEGKLFNLAPQYNPGQFAQMIDGLAARRRDIRIQATKIKYSQEIAELETKHEMASAYTEVGKLRGKHSAYSRQVNTLLGLKDTDTHSAWYSAQEWADKQVGRAWNTMRGAYVQSQASGNWEKMGELLKNYGLPVLLDKQDDFVLSHLIGLPEQNLARVMGQINGIFATSMLRLDAIAMAVNVMSRPILASPAITGLLHDIKTTPAQEAKILQLTHVVDEAKGYKIPTQAKLQYQAAIDFVQRPHLVREMADHGIIPNDTDSVRQMVESTGFKAHSESVEKWIARVNTVAEKASLPANHTESFIKFVSAREAQQVLDAIGLSKQHPLYWSAIAEHVNHIHGNYTASQRPTLFQGWAGQAIGLFQTYQFNMIQQFMKHVGDKNGAAKKMLAIQTGIFGSQSLPGFQWLNEYIAERTVGERDIFSETGKTLDTPVAEFLLYGGGSSLTRPLVGGKGLDFFSRGNLNPRSPILVPTSVDEVPAFKAVESLFKLLHDPIKNMLGGQDVAPAIWDALAHNGLNRPIAGAAQIWGAGVKTSKAGVTLVNYQDLDWATATAKLLGTQTMNEAIATQSYYRSLGYRTWRMEQLQELGADFRRKIRNADGVTGDDLTSVMREYVKLGGKERSFNRWMKNQYANANGSVIGELRNTLDSREGRYLQRVLGNNVDGLDVGARTSLVQ